MLDISSFQLTPVLSKIDWKNYSMTARFSSFLRELLKRKLNHTVKISCESQRAVLAVNATAI